jgi:hypothetical protein
MEIIMAQRRTILMCEKNILLALQRRWIRYADLEGDEFLFYFVQSTASIARPPEIRKIYDIAEKESRIYYRCDVPDRRNCGPLEAFLKGFSLENELDCVLAIFEGAPAEFIADYYTRRSEIRVLGPINPLSGFSRRWEGGYAYIQR